MTSTPLRAARRQRHVHAHGCRQSPLARPREQVVIDELARAGSGFHGKLLRQSSTSWRRRQGLLRDGSRSARPCSKSAHRGEAQGRDYSGLSDEQMVDDHHYFLFPNTVCNVYAGHFITARIDPTPPMPSVLLRHVHLHWLSDEERSERRAAGTRPSTREPRSAASRTRISAPSNVQLGCIRRAREHPALRAEIRVLHFHQVLDQLLFGDEFGGEGKGPGHDTGGRTPLQAAARAVPRTVLTRTRGTRVLCRIMEGPPRGSPHRNRATGRVRLGDGPCHRVSHLDVRMMLDAGDGPHPHGVPGIYEGPRERATRRPDLPVLGSEIHLAEQHPSSRPRYAGGRRVTYEIYGLC